MFEAVVAVCLTLAEDNCRQVLLPGYEARDAAGCEERLSIDPPRVNGIPVCRQMGDALEMSEVAPGIFVHQGAVAEPNKQNRGDVSNLGFVVGESAVAVIDTGAAAWIGEALWRAIRAKTDKPVTHVILTHMHPDHVLGAAAFSGPHTQVVGHAGLPRALADRQENYRESLARLIGNQNFIGSEIVTVTNGIADRAEIDLGGRILELRAWGPAHTRTDLTVFDRETGTLFSGDLVFHRHIPALDGLLGGWREVLGELSASQAIRQVVPGHGGPVLDWPEGGFDLERYLAVLEADTRATLEAGMRLGEAVERIATSEAVHWELFEAFNARNATVAFTELEWD